MITISVLVFFIIAGKSFNLMILKNFQVTKAIQIKFVWNKDFKLLSLNL